MNLNYSSKAFNQLTHNELSKRSAIHQAGHALAIYLNNRQKQLPPFFFQIYYQEQPGDPALSQSLWRFNDKGIAELADKRLTQNLPLSLQEATKAISSEQTRAYEHAFEADVVGLLAGPLAEAKYVAMRDGELINPRLVNLNALHYYGGAYDLEIVNDYLACSILGKAEREKKIADLFFDAFDFINNGSNWLAITVLAYYILTDSSHIIECEEIMPHLMPSLVRS
jgi:hypothetical protein